MVGNSVLFSGPLGVHTSRSGRACTVAIRGELDLANILVVERQLGAALGDRSCATVTVDLRGLEFIDSTGIALLIRTLSRDTDHRLRFIPSESRAVTKVLELTGVADRLTEADGPSA